MTLRTTPAGLDLIRKFEGLRLKSYRCAAGVWTIGYGHTTAAGGQFTLASGEVTSKVHAGQQITNAEAERLFAADIDLFENSVEKLLTGITEVSAAQFDAMVSLAFNIGIGAFAKSTVLRRLKRGDEEGAAAAFMMWTKAGGKFTVGLHVRRKAEVDLFNGDRDGASRGSTLDFQRAVPDKPQPPKTMATSKTGNSAIVTGAGGALAAGKAVVDTVNETVASARDGVTTWMELATAAGPWLLLGLVLIGGAAFIWWDRRRKLEGDLV